ncbi:MAG: HigA family addiction module antitoxin [Corynebacterium pyruviciproducens]|uniref:HigA family addiction module antitoxin n=1 Tax=Corynebacterium pyruviciproducens TaxID=598660 RepID=UPI0023F2C6C0|nr:HigA family addiction module antitoxin [Corynebacterium pyruviciproducens]MDK7213328.1 HigA family addiction module antitoxin [Corynebacterium pyruviciproducens]
MTGAGTSYVPPKLHHIGRRGDEPPRLPGAVLMEDYMIPLGVSQNGLARAIHVPPRRVNEIVHGDRAITPDTAVRLARYFGTTPHKWLSLQAHYDTFVLLQERGAEYDTIAAHQD